MTPAQLLQDQIADRLLNFANFAEVCPDLTTSDLQGLASAQAREIMTMCGVKEPRKVDQQQLLI